MHKKLLANLKPFLKSLFVIGLIFTLIFGQADGALAARSGGRIGGGSFRSAPTRTYAPSGGGYQQPGGYYRGGGGFGFPFLLPFFGFGFGGFGSLLTILVFAAVANYMVNAFRRTGETQELGYTNNPSVSVARVQVGLLAQARSLQTDLDRMAQTADTGSAAGRAQVLQEATLALLRHPEYWVYGAAQSQQIGLDAAEAKFNQWTLAERSKVTEETLSNVNSQLKAAGVAALPTDSITSAAAPNEYLVVTLCVGAQGKIQFPNINSTEDLKRVLSQIGSIASEQLLAVEILWTPQASDDTLTSDDMLTYYPDLKLV